MATLSTHVLDTAAGRPAAGVAVRLESRDGDVLDRSVTDDGSFAWRLNLNSWCPAICSNTSSRLIMARAASGSAGS